MTNTSFLHSNLRFLRLSKRYKQKELCSIIGVPTSTYSQWESGLSKIADPTIITKLTDLFGVSLSELTDVDLSKTLTPTITQSIKGDANTQQAGNGNKIGCTDLSQKVAMLSAENELLKKSLADKQEIIDLLKNKNK